MRKFYLGVFLSLIAVLTINQDATGSERTDAKKFEKLLAQQSKQLKDQQKMLDAQNRQLLELQSRLDTMSDEQVVPASSKAMSKNRKNNKSVSSLSTDQPSQAAANSSQQQPQAPSGKQRLKEMPKDTKPPEIPRVSADVGGVQTPKGRFVVEPTVQYSYTKSQRVNIAGFTVGPVLFGLFNQTRGGDRCPNNPLWDD